MSANGSFAYFRVVVDILEVGWDLVKPVATKVSLYIILCYRNIHSDAISPLAVLSLSGADRRKIGKEGFRSL